MPLPSLQRAERDSCVIWYFNQSQPNIGSGRGSGNFRFWTRNVIESATFSRLSVFSSYIIVLKEKREEKLQYNKSEVFVTRAPNTLKVIEKVQNIRGKILNVLGEFSMSFFILQKTPIEKANFSLARRIFELNLKDLKSYFIFKSK